MVMRPQRNGLASCGLINETLFTKSQDYSSLGNLDDPEQRGRMIIDCLMNLPLLYFAAKMTGKQEYYEAAYNHAKQTQNILCEKITLRSIRIILIRKQAKLYTVRRNKDIQTILVGLAAKPGEFTALR